MWRETKEGRNLREGVSDSAHLRKLRISVTRLPPVSLIRLRSPYLTLMIGVWGKPALVKTRKEIDEASATLSGQSKARSFADFWREDWLTLRGRIPRLWTAPRPPRRASCSICCGGRLLRVPVRSRPAAEAVGESGPCRP